MLVWSHKRLHEWYNNGNLSKTKKIFQAIGDQGEETDNISFLELDHSAIQVAKYLQNNRNLKKGETVMLMYPPDKPLHFVVGLLGCIYGGYIAVPVSPPHPGANFQYSMRNICNIMRDSQVKVCLSTYIVIQMIKMRLITTRSIDVPRNLEWVAIDDVNNSIPIYLSGQKLEDNSEEIIKRENITILDPNEDDVMMIQYSSGSTGQPKGIMLTHKNVFINSRNTMEFCKPSSDDAAVSWLPFYHDMGLMTHLFTPILVAGLQVLMSPLTFLKNPFLWLQTIDKYRARMSGGPNFAYAILSSKYSHMIKDSNIDLSCWKIAFCGAEPIRYKTISDFCDAFKDTGICDRSFYPSYGLAEATLMVSCSRDTEAPSFVTISRSDSFYGDGSMIDIKSSWNGCSSIDGDPKKDVILVGLGNPWKSIQLRVVNPETKKICLDGQIGEIWIKSETVSKGYWGNPELTKDTFEAYTSDTNEGPFLRTGDLGFLLNNQLFFTSRLKDLIIINGVNIWPQDIENTVEESHSHLRKGCCAAFSQNDEKIVIVAEIKKGIDLSEKESINIKSTIQKRIFDHHMMSVDQSNIKLISPGTLPKTTSGKIRRKETKKRFEDNQLSYAHEKKIQRNFNQIVEKITLLLLGIVIWFSDAFRKIWRSSNRDDQKKKEIKLFLLNVISKQINIDPSKIDTKTPLPQYGLKSVDAVAICGEMEKMINKKISPTCFYHYFTIDSLTEFLFNGAPDLEETSDTSQFNLFPPSKCEINKVDDRKCYVLGMGNSHPDIKVEQSNSFNLLLQNSTALSNHDNLPKIERVFRGTGIKSRYVTLPPDELSKLVTTEERNQVYIEHAPKLAAKSARKALDNWGGDIGDITHVISVSCTGTIVPGLEFLLIDELGLNRNVIRLGINFMGCFGGLSGLRTAQSLAMADSRNRILVVCTELCCLHVQKDDMRFDNLVAEAIFGDGSAAMVVGQGLRANEKGMFEIIEARCHALPNSTNKIRWDLSNTGYKVGLEPDISILLSHNIKAFCQGLIDSGAKEQGLTFDRCHWAIHPGGKAIIELIEKQLDLVTGQTKSTWDIYKEFGNMSSATILMILQKLFESSATIANGAHVVSLAFGPGLSVEGVLLKFIN